MTMMTMMLLTVVVFMQLSPGTPTLKSSLL